MAVEPQALSQVTWHVLPLVTMEWKLLLSVVASLILSDRAHRSPPPCPRPPVGVIPPFLHPCIGSLFFRHLGGNNLASINF